MPDTLGPVAIPVPPVIRDFPLIVDYGTAREIAPAFYIHRFDSPGLKTEQRFFRGTGGRRFRIVKSQLFCEEVNLLRDHWHEAKGLYSSFFYNHPLQGGGVERVSVHYGDQALNFSHQVALLAGDPGLTLVECFDNATSASLTSTRTDYGLVSDVELASLLGTEQELVPLIEIRPRGLSDVYYLSDRRITIDSHLYLPRLLDWTGMTQSCNSNNDSTQFRVGNADGIWTELVKTVNLKRAELRFGFFDKKTSAKVWLWRGYVRQWTRDPASRVFQFDAADGIFELNLPYPSRQISRTCWKEFKSPWCPYTGPLTTCAKSWAQCQERAMTRYFGGQIVNAQSVSVKDNSSGTWGFGRSVLRSVTVREDSIYQRVLQEVYTDMPMIVQCDVAGGRDEGDFYSALGIVGEGPIGGYSTDLTKHLLDDQPPHDPQKNGGWRGVLGHDPSDPAIEWFGLSQAPWGSVPPGSTFAAGTAFAEIRRTDAKGLQLSKIADRKMSVTVTAGIGGWIWRAPGDRVWATPLTNAVWVAVNVYLRGLGMKADFTRPDLVSIQEMESFLLIDSIIAAAGLCDTVVPKLVGTGNERQFPFRGALREQKPVRDWMGEILTCCLGYYYFIDGRLGIGIRVNSSVLAGNAFTRATVLESTFSAEPRESEFNHLTMEFGDEEFDWTLNSVQVYDIDNANFEGTASAPRFKASRQQLVGVSNKSQASRIAITRLKEELGGAILNEQSAARNVRLRSSVIALKTLPGDICSFDDPMLPNGRVEFRVVSRTLNSDWSVDIEGTPTCDSMYDVVVGPKPDDVKADPVPPERFLTPQGLKWLPNKVQPYPNDPMYGEDEWTFALWQEYDLSTTGDWEAAIWVRGEMVVNTFQGYDMPMIYGATWQSDSNSHITGGTVYYIAICQRDSSFTGRYTPLSNLVALWVPPGQWTIHLPSIVPIKAQSWPGYAVYMGTDWRTMCKQVNETNKVLPTTFDIGTFYRQTDPMPWADARKVRIKVKPVRHSGVAGIQVQSVPAANQIRSSEWIGSTDNWVGQILSVIADWSDLSVPLWNFTITAFEPATGTITVNPPCVRDTPENSVQEGDVMIVRAKVTASTATTATCSLWRNSIARVQFGSDGLDPEEEKGLLLRVLDGKGAGQTRLIASSTQDTHTVERPWTTQPDTTSIVIVEEVDWSYTSETSTPLVEQGLQDVDIRVSVPNLANRVALVGGFLVDEQEHETFEELAVLREIYVYGEPYRVRGTEGTSADTGNEDQTLRVDTSAGDVTVDLTPAGPYFGRTMLIVNDGLGENAGRVIVKPYTGDEFQTSENEVIIEKPGDWCEFVAAGDPNDLAVQPEARRTFIPGWRMPPQRLRRARGSAIHRYRGKGRF